MRALADAFRAGVPDLSELRAAVGRTEAESGMPLREITVRWQPEFSLETVFGPPIGKTPSLPAPPGTFRCVRAGAEYPYLLYLPDGYPQAGRYPLLLFLHGIGERGDDPAALAVFGPFQHILRGHALPFIIAAPQAEAGAHWTEDADGNETDAQMLRLKAFLRRITETWAVDPARVCLTGLSMGGRGAFKLACRLPDTFAAAAVCCGRAGAREAPEQLYYPLENMQNLPLWLFHGLEDATVSPAHTLSALRRLRALNPRCDARLTLYPGVKHHSFEPAYRDARLYAWLEAQRKSSGKAVLG